MEKGGSMKTRGRTWLGVLAIAGGVLLLSPGVQADHPEGDARLRDQGGVPVGRVQFEQLGDGVLVTARVRALPPGFHGFHIHGTGQCVPPFTGAGGHFNPGGGPHGQHAGDMPVLLVNENGTGQTSFVTDRFTIHQLDDADGSAVIVHQNPDTYANIPERYHSHTEDTFGPDSETLATGDAGARLACGVIRSR